jgi:hypothetical protein
VNLKGAPRKLKFLACASEELEDLSDLGPCEELEMVCLYAPRVVDVGVFGMLETLASVSLATSTTDIGPLRACKGLKMLSLRAPALHDVETIKDFKSLKTLYFNACAFSDVGGIGELLDLEFLKFDTCPKVVDISSLERLRLKTFDSIDTPLSTIKPIIHADLTGLFFSTYAPTEIVLREDVSHVLEYTVTDFFHFFLAHNDHDFWSWQSWEDAELHGE